MKLISLVKTILLSLTFLLFLGCSGGPDILAGRYFSGIYDPWGTPTTRAMPPEVWISCPSGGSGCRSSVDNYGLLYDYVTVVLRTMDTIYSYYAANRMNELIQVHGEEFREGFPGIEQERPGAIDSLLDGRYSIKVLMDSSIVIVNHSKDSISAGEIIFALDRQSLPKN